MAYFHPDAEGFFPKIHNEVTSLFNEFKREIDPIIMLSGLVRAVLWIEKTFHHLILPIAYFFNSSLIGKHNQPEN